MKLTNKHILFLLVAGAMLAVMGCYKMNSDDDPDEDGDLDTDYLIDAECNNAKARKCEEAFEECTEICKLNPLGCDDSCYDEHCACLNNAGCNMSKIEACQGYSFSLSM
ncbi:MAG: hypothetical protein GY854_11845 [Deltaproteobacteria bacterium]|nr:hypothetical protein [Deltaproteobacteria bacterium]